MRVIRVILFLSYFVLLVRAEESTLCTVCRQPLPVQYYVVGNPALGERSLVCESCNRLETICFVCGLPVKFGYLKMDDGRLLCERHAKSAVLSHDGATRIYEEVKRDLAGVLSGLGVSPGRNITLFLVNQPELENLHKAANSTHDKLLTMGFTRTRLMQNNEFDHAIYLLSGLGPSRLKAVCAHEFAHAWVNENVARERQMEKDAEEGFCELVAYKLMTLRNDEPEKKAIRDNTYTKGQIDAFIKADGEYRFFRVVEWMKNGVDAALVQTNLVRLLALNDGPIPSFVWHPQVATSVPDTLMLKGISGTPKRRFALINDRTLEKNERAKIRVGSSSVSVRCLDISENSVVIKLDGSEEKQELFLSANQALTQPAGAESRAPSRR